MMSKVFGVIIAAWFWLGSALGGSGPPGTVDVWVATYAPASAEVYGGQSGNGLSYYQLASYQKGSDAYAICDLSGRKRSLASRVEYQQPGRPPFSVLVPTTLEVPAWGCGAFNVAIETGRLGTWSNWDVFVSWEDYGKVPIYEGWAEPAK